MVLGWSGRWVGNLRQGWGTSKEVPPPTLAQVLPLPTCLPHFSTSAWRGSCAHINLDTARSTLRTRLAQGDRADLLAAARKRVVVLLRTLGEARVCYTEPSTGEGGRLMPSVYNEGSYVELERQLAWLRDTHRREWWHVSSRFRWGGEQWLEVRTKSARGGGSFVLPGGCELTARPMHLPGGVVRIRVYRWSEDVDMRLVARGVGLLAGRMHQGEWDRINLPKLYLPLVEEVAELPHVAHLAA